MGYKQVAGVTSFTPDDDVNTIHIPRSATISDIIDTVKAKWGADVDLDTIEVAAEHIHTDYVTHDVYDSSDYTDFLAITR